MNLCHVMVTSDWNSRSLNFAFLFQFLVIISVILVSRELTDDDVRVSSVQVCYRVCVCN